MVYSNYVKQRILHLRRTGRSYSQIADHLASEGHYVTKPRISYFLKTYKDTASIVRKPGLGGRARKAELSLTSLIPRSRRTTKYHFLICSHSWNRRSISYYHSPLEGRARLDD